MTIKKYVPAALAALVALGANPTHAGQYVVTTRIAQDDAGERFQKWFPEMAVKRRMADRRRWVINLPDHNTRLIEALKRYNLIEAVEPDIQVQANLVPNDPYFSQ